MAVCSSCTSYASGLPVGLGRATVASHHVGPIRGLEEAGPKAPPAVKLIGWPQPVLPSQSGQPCRAALRIKQGAPHLQGRQQKHGRKKPSHSYHIYDPPGAPLLTQDSPQNTLSLGQQGGLVLLAGPRFALRQGCNQGGQMGHLGGGAKMTKWHLYWLLFCPSCAVGSRGGIHVCP